MRSIIINIITITIFIIIIIITVSYSSSWSTSSLYHHHVFLISITISSWSSIIIISIASPSHHHHYNITMPSSASLISARKPDSKEPQMRWRPSSSWKTYTPPWGIGLWIYLEIRLRLLLDLMFLESWCGCLFPLQKPSKKPSIGFFAVANKLMSLYTRAWCQTGSTIEIEVLFSLYFRIKL